MATQKISKEFSKRFIWLTVFVWIINLNVAKRRLDDAFVRIRATQSMKASHLGQVVVLWMVTWSASRRRGWNHSCRNSNGQESLAKLQNLKIFTGMPQLIELLLLGCINVVPSNVCTNISARQNRHGYGEWNWTSARVWRRRHRGNVSVGLVCTWTVWLNQLMI